jgi:hypothetical protein
LDRARPACTCRRPRPAVRTTRQALTVRAEVDSRRAWYGRLCVQVVARELAACALGKHVGSCAARLHVPSTTSCRADDTSISGGTKGTRPSPTSIAQLLPPGRYRQSPAVYQTSPRLCAPAPLSHPTSPLFHRTSPAKVQPSFRCRVGPARNSIEDFYPLQDLFHQKSSFSASPPRRPPRTSRLLARNLRVAASPRALRTEAIFQAQGATSARVGETILISRRFRVVQRKL